MFGVNRGWAELLRIICFLLISLGDVLMIFTAIRYSRLIRRILSETDKNEKTMRSMLIGLSILPFFFAMGYTVAAIYVIFVNVELFFLMVALIFFFGAIFVAAVVQVQVVTTAKLRQQNSALQSSQLIVQDNNRNLQNEIDIRLKTLLHQESLLRMINKVAAMLLATGTGNFEETLNQCMEMIGEAVDVDRIYVWRNKLEDGTLYYEKMFGWERASNRPAVPDPPPEKLPFADDVMGWQSKFSRGESIKETYSGVDETERTRMRMFGIMSMMMVPVFLQDEQWGFVSFDNCHAENKFLEIQEKALGSASLLFVNAVINNNNEQILKTRFSQQSEVLRITQSFLTKGYAERIEDALGAIGAMLGATRVLIIISDGGNNKSRAIYSWSADKSLVLDTSQGGFEKIIEASFPKTIAEDEPAPVVYCNDISQEKKYSIFDKVGAKSFIWAPLYAYGVLRGVLSVEDCVSVREWSESDKQLVSMVSSVIAGAITRDNSEKERAEALDEAVRASKAKGDFLSNMSHEMRTPMNAIIGMATIGRTAPDIEKKNYSFDKIEGASAHMLGVINDILDMSKIEANRMELVLTEFSFEKMLTKVVNVINFRVEEKQQDFTVYIDNKLPQTLIGDDQRFAQIMTNLLSNAVKFTPQNGFIHMEARLVSRGSSHCKVRVSVTDSGIGLSQEQQSRLFASFAQAESSTSRKYGGTGLGLAITKRIIDLMNGHIWIESELDKGASFIFEVDVRIGADKKAPLLSANSGLPEMRVVIVDESVNTCKYFCKTAADLGLVCECASDAESARKLISGASYDICFINRKMQDDDGSEFIGWVKQNRPRGCKLVVLSSTDWSALGSEALTGADAFLSKPILPISIVDCLDSLMGSGKPIASVEEALETDSFEGHCILLVEDVELNREILTALLEPTGLQIECAENGAEAVKIYSEAPDRYELIFMDIQMPKMDGYEATQQIRALPSTHAKWVPIIAMTANVFREDVEKCLAAGMDDHIGKPLELEEVLKRLRKYLSDSYSCAGQGGDESGVWEKGLQWLPEFETGYEHIDEQHKEIFRVAHNFFEACATRESNEFVGDTLKRMVEYIELHFGDEEALQRKYEYYEYKNHLKMHDLFRKKIDDLNKLYEANGSSKELANIVNVTIVRWLAQHIKTEDAKVAAHIRNFNK